MVTVFCAGCGDRLRRTTVYTAVRGVLRLILTERVQWRHTTKRWDNRYTPDTTTLSQIKRRLSRNGRFVVVR